VNVDDDEVGDRLQVDVVKVGNRYVRMLLIWIRLLWSIELWFLLTWIVPFYHPILYELYF
jgi:hypothetical protein